MPSRYVVALLTVASIGVVPFATDAHGGSCLAQTETRNSWHRLHPPAQDALVAADADNPCTMTAASTDGHTWRSGDGGTTWRDGGVVPAHVRGLFRAGLPADHVIALPQGAGLYLSTDNGSSWAAVQGMSDVTVAAVAADVDDRSGVYAAGAHTAPVSQLGTTPAGSVFSSSDGGASWQEDARGLPIHPHVVARLGQPYLAVFADDSNSDQLWERTDMGAFTPVYSDRVADLAVSPLKGGGSELYVAGAAGVVVSRDGGATYSAMSPANDDATAVAPEFNHYTAFLYVAGGTVRRSTNGGRTSRPVDTGLPASCAPTSLVGDHGDPSSYLLRCADGTTYRYRSDGSDLSDADTVTSDTTSNGLSDPLNQIVPQPMTLLATRELPSGRGESASIAFDGTFLYYATSSQVGVLHRIVAVTGAAAPDIALPGMHVGVIAMMYDSKRHMLYLADADAQTHALALRTGRLTHLFAGPYPASCPGCAGPTGSMTFDPSSDEFVYVADTSPTPNFFDRAGQPTRTCTLSSNGVATSNNLAAIVASGDGGFYGEEEDDATVVKFDASCHVTALFQHPTVSEAPDENDAMACDTTSFPQAAIWIRDADLGTASAYAIPDGYCALATTMSVTAPPSVTTGAAGTVCAHLHRLGTGAPIVANTVQLFVANRLVGSVPTDRSGTACSLYRPTASEAGRRSTTATTASTRARQPVVGTFLGTKAYRPASARAELAALDPGQPAPPPSHLVAPLAYVPPQPVAAAAPPGIVAPPAPPAPPAPQPQPLPQAHPGAQPGAAPMGQPGAAFQPEQEAEAATANIRSDEFRAHAAPAPTPDLRVLLPAGVLLAAAVARRRRASRVRSQVT